MTENIITQTKVKCSLPMPFIRREFLSEAEKSKPNAWFHDRANAVWREGLASLKLRLEGAKTEDDLDEIIFTHANMGLHEWIESL